MTFLAAAIKVCFCLADNSFWGIARGIKRHDLLGQIERHCKPLLNPLAISPGKQAKSQPESEHPAIAFVLRRG
jgi:hypothetical protein